MFSYLSCPGSSIPTPCKDNLQEPVDNLQEPVDNLQEPVDNKALNRISFGHSIISVMKKKMW